MEGYRPIDMGNQKVDALRKGSSKGTQDYGAVNVDNSMICIQLYAIDSISYKNDLPTRR